MTETVERLRRAPPRSWLFVPALKAKEWIPKAAAAGADAVIVDLEDATAPAEKERAREFVRTLQLSGMPDASSGSAADVQRPSIFVRVNTDPETLEVELSAAAQSGAVGIVIPKVDRPGMVVGAAWHGLALVPMIESARGLLRAAEIAAAHEQVAAIAFGSFDFAADIGAIISKDGDELAYARAMVVVAAAAAGVAAIDTPWLDLGDPDGAGREAERGRRLGFSGKLAVHPKQVRPINAAFVPSDDEVKRARGIVEALDAAIAAGNGVATYEGRMVDRPLALAARRVLARAELARGRG
jgi:citrate lyase subunit beta/citryl-CoA lyase